MCAVEECVFVHVCVLADAKVNTRVVDVLMCVCEMASVYVWTARNPGAWRWRRRRGKHKQEAEQLPQSLVELLRLLWFSGLSLVSAQNRNSTLAGSTVQSVQ